MVLFCCNYSKKLFKLILTLLIIVLYNFVYAQPQAAFTPSIVEGCAGTTISFVNQSSGCIEDPVYHWDFDDGRESTETNPVLYFSESGTFNVVLTLNCDGVTEIAEVEIELFESPSANFSAVPINGCVPLEVDFTDASVAGEGNLEEWLWHFGDGTTSTDVNPTHIYGSSNNWTVSLKVTDDNNCSNTKVDTSMISVSNFPVVDFWADNTESCEESLTVNFSANVLTSLGLDYEYHWTFGDGTSSNEASPQKIFPAGVYDITLTITDDFGCETVLTKEEYIRVIEPEPEYLIMDGADIIDGNIVCKSVPLYFENLTGYSCEWDFGPYQTTNDPATYSFATAGDVTVLFTIDPDGVCETTTEINLLVEEVTASFSTDPPADIFSCITPLEVSFFNESSPNAVSYFYVFADGNHSNEENPTHSYISPGVFAPALTVTSENGCSNTFVAPPINIVTPNVDIHVDPDQGCAPLEIEFSYTGTTPQSEIQEYHWDFGDGNEIFDGSETEINVFTNPGEYEVTLSVIDNNDCVGMAVVEIIVGDVYEPDFDVVTYEDHDPLTTIWPNLNLCAQDSVELYLWEHDQPEFEDYEFYWFIDSTDNAVSDQHMLWQFDQDTGWITIHMITNNNGCLDTLLWDSVYVSGPIINGISRDYDCASTLDYTFEANHILGETFDWFAYYIEDEERIDVFSELDTPDSIWNISFLEPGEYWIQVIAYNDTTPCEFIDSIKVTTTNLQAVFTLIQSAVCVGETVTFNAGSSTDANQYMWDFGDGNNSGWIFDEVYQYAYENVGDYTVTLHVKDSQGCEDSMTDNISALGPEIIIDADPVIGCNSLDVNFTCLSLPENYISFTYWEFGGTQSAYGSEVSHSYPEPGTYSVTVTVGTYDNCIADMVFEDLINVVDIYADFTSENHIGCVGDEMSVNSVLENPLFTYTWDFGDGNQSNDLNPVHQYESGGSYTVSLHITDGNECSEFVNYPNFFVIEEPIADFSLDQPIIPCWPDDPGINSNISVIPDDTELLYKWTMGNSDTLFVENPQYLYYVPGEYEITLNLTTPNGCTDTHFEKLIVQGPYADVSVSNNTACVGDELTFEVSNFDNVDSFLWIFDDGTTSEEQNTTHTYNYIPSGNVFNAKLQISDGDCVTAIDLPISIFMVEAGILISNETETGNVEVYEACSPFNATIISNSVNDVYRYWFIEQEAVADGEVQFEHIFINNSTEDIVNSISLIVEDDNNCSDTVSVDVTIFALPTVGITNDTVICLGDEIDLFATGGDSYIWSPNQNISSINIPNPKISPDESMLYSVSVFSENNCETKDSVFIEVFFPPEVSLLPEIDTIIIGDTVYASLTVDQENLSYLWTPQTFISCYDCPEPSFFPEESMRYSLVVEDSLGCFRYNYFIDIIVIEEYSIDLPTAFTPLGHESNQKVHVRGMGIRNLLQFRIYNRWGEEVFFTDDINEGWDGYYNGELQNIDTYVYYVEAEMYDGNVVSKKGNILLMR